MNWRYGVDGFVVLWRKVVANGEEIGREIWELASGGGECMAQEVLDRVRAATIWDRALMGTTILDQKNS